MATIVGARRHEVDGTTVPRVVAGLVDRPRLFALLDRGALGPVTLVSAPAGSGKTTLLASWLRRTRPTGAVAWVAVERDEADAAHFWSLVMAALRGSGAIPTEDPLADLAPAPQGGQGEFLRHLIAGLERLSEPVLLVLDDLHQLRAEDALADLAELLGRAPAPLRAFVLARQDPPLQLHRLRLAGELVEIRAGDLGFSAEEAGELLAGAGASVNPADLARLHGRTEGWAAGLRLAALSLTRTSEPDRFVAEFSGSERTVADYLLAEVLAGCPPEVRRLLLRTCVLDRVNGALADLLTGRADGAARLAELEEANALVVAVDVSRTWFRYHRLLADLLRAQLGREAPQEVPELHRLAARWHAEHGDPVEAIRHAAAGGDVDLATDLLGEQWTHLLLDGREHALEALLAGLPRRRVEADAELATIAAAGRLAASRWAQADALLATARTGIASVPPLRQGRARTALATVALLRARRIGDLEDAVAEADAMLRDEDGAAALDGASRAGTLAAPDLAAFALMNLGIAESWTFRLAAAEAHLDRGLALARELGRPYLEVGCLATLGVVALVTSRLDEAERRSREAIALAERRGWFTQPIIGAAHVTLAAVALERGAAEDAERHVERAAEILAGAPEPASTVGLWHTRGMLEIARERFGPAAAAFGEAARLAAELRAPHFLARRALTWQLRAQLRLGELEPVREAIAGWAPTDAEACTIGARLRLAEDDAEGAAAAVAPVLAGTAPAFHPNIEVEAVLLDAVARAGLGEPAEESVERALALTEPQGRVWMVLTVPGIAELLRAHPVHRTAHAAHLKALLDLATGSAAPPPAALPEPLSDRELAVLRFLPTNLSAGDIGSELYLSVHTVKTHMRKLYAKLGVHTRAEAVARGRALGLLSPSRR